MNKMQIINTVVLFFISYYQMRISYLTSVPDMVLKKWACIEQSCAS